MNTERPDPKPARQAARPRQSIGAAIGDWVNAHNQALILAAFVIGIVIWAMQAYSPEGRLKSAVKRFPFGVGRHEELIAADRAIWVAWKGEIKAAAEDAVWASCLSQLCSVHAMRVFSTADRGNLVLSVSIDLVAMVDSEFEEEWSRWWPSKPRWVVRNMTWEVARDSKDRRLWSHYGDMGDDAELAKLSARVGNEATAQYLRATARNLFPLVPKD